MLFFLFYLAIPLAFARRQAGRLERYVDATLVFGVPLVAFGLQVGLVRGIEYGAAWSALALAALYLVLAKAVWRRAGERLRLLAESFLALGVVFGTLAIPLALEGRWTVGGLGARRRGDRLGRRAAAAARGARASVSRSSSSPGSRSSPT